MGIFDLFRGKSSGGPGGPAKLGGPSAADTPKKALAAAQERRRAGAPLTGNRGTPLGPNRFGGYERLERQIVVRTGRFPWTNGEAQQALSARGFAAKDVEAYLRSDAAKRLLQ